MSRAIASRIRRLEGQFGWRTTMLVAPDGEERGFASLDLVDAWLRVMLDGDPPGLLPDASRFIATARMRQSSPEFLLGLREACRDVWFPERRRDQHQRDVDELDADPPTPDAPEPTPIPSRRRQYGGATRA